MSAGLCACSKVFTAIRMSANGVTSRPARLPRLTIRHVGFQDPHSRLLCSRIAMRRLIPRAKRYTVNKLLSSTGSQNSHNMPRDIALMRKKFLSLEIFTRGDLGEGGQQLPR